MENDVLLNLVQDPNPEAIKLSLMDCHVPGLMSLVLDGEPGNLTRVFIAYSEIKASQVALHSHRYGLRIKALTQGIWHQVAVETLEEEYLVPNYLYESAIFGSGQLKFVKNVNLKLNSNPMPCNSSVHLFSDDIHTMWCDAGSVWLVEELGYEAEVVHTYGKPFNTDGLYNKPTKDDLDIALGIVIKTLTV